jgi:hypothetical protein
MSVRPVFTVLLLILSGAIVWALLSASLGESLARTLADPWGVVMLIDLYAGFAIMIALYALMERPAVVVILALATLVLGNVVPLGWLLWRGWSRLSTLRSENP